MTRYWWVNHNQTFAHERGEGYLWSPKREANVARSQFYENMRIARTGDGVVSYAGKRIKAVGRVASEATTARKPVVFGSVGENWAADGWLLPVSWSSVNHEPTPAHHLDDIAPLLPTKYSPINPKTGFGNQKAYMAEISAVNSLPCGWWIRASRAPRILRSKRCMSCEGTTVLGS